MRRSDLRILPRTVQQLTVEKLRAAILDGMFKPGERLIEVDLCEMLGVSRPSVREALRSLEAERLVSIIPNRGPQIPVLTWLNASEIYRVRMLMEGEAAALCARNATPADHKKMAVALAAFSKAAKTDDAAGRLASTGAFYDEIMRLCGNSIIHEIVSGLYARITFLRGRSMSLPGRGEKSLEEMKAILAAIEAGDAEAARAAAIHHVQQAHDAARTVYEFDAKEDSAALSA